MGRFIGWSQHTLLHLHRHSYRALRDLHWGRRLLFHGWQQIILEAAAAGSWNANAKFQPARHAAARYDAARHGPAGHDAARDAAAGHDVSRHAAASHAAARDAAAAVLSCTRVKAAVPACSRRQGSIIDCTRFVSRAPAIYGP